jgi:hypothetical protein
MPLGSEQRFFNYMDCCVGICGKTCTVYPRYAVICA